MTVIIDASVTVAALTDSGPVGSWADSLLASQDLAAPHLLPAEVANTLRRIEGVGAIPADVAAMAHDALNRLHIDFYPYEPFADRIWECVTTSRVATLGTSRWARRSMHQSPHSTND